MGRRGLWLLIYGVLGQGAFCSAAWAQFEAAQKAVTQFRSGDAHGGRALLNARRKHPVIGTALAVLEAESLLQRKHFKKAEQRAIWVMERDPRWVHRAAWIAGLATLEEDCQRALSYFESVRVDPPWILRAALLSKKRDAFSKCGQQAEALAIDRRLYTEFPGSETGAYDIGSGKRWTADRIRRAQALTKARRYKQAISILDEVIKTGVLTHEARLARGQLQLNFLRNDYDAALKDFTVLCNGQSKHAEEACFLRGKTLGRKGDLIGAMDGYEGYLSSFPSGRYADESRFFSAFLLYENGRFKRARSAFGKLVSGPWAGAALWYRAWSSYLAKDYPDARTGFERIIDSGKPLSRAVRKARYWTIRIIAQTEPDVAMEQAREMVAALPHDWYALLLRRRYPGRFGPLPALSTVGAKRPLTNDGAFSHQIKEIRQLHRVGLPGFARRALGYLAPRIRAAGLPGLEAELALLIGDARRALKATLSRDTGFLKQGPRAETAHRWYAAYPLGYAALIKSIATTEQVDLADVLSFVRKESAFHPDAISHAHAVGLMQLLPKTAERILGASNFPKDELPKSRLTESPMQRLFEPAVNLRLAVWYVARLSERFSAQKPLVAAAYNAGPVAVVQWIGDRVEADTDEFVETIPFREAREYVKKWMSTRIVYDLVHGGVGLERAVQSIPLKLNLRVNAGVHF